MNGQSYSSACRMPGLLPIYSFFRLFFSVDITRILVIFAQFLCGIISVRCLALIARQLFNSNIYSLVLIVYSLSSFVSIWDHYGLSDSFSVSFLIFSVYFLIKFIYSQVNLNLILSGLFIAWSVFFRPVVIIIMPLYLIVLYRGVSYKLLFQYVKQAVILCSILFLFLLVWVFYNYKRTQRFIPLQDTMENCFSSYPLHFQKITDLVIGWGGDYQKWHSGGEMHWFLNKNIDVKKSNPFSSNIYTSVYNYDSIVKLRQAYFLSVSQGIDSKLKKYYIDYVTENATLYKSVYEKEHPLNFYIFNRLRLIVNFCFPLHLENLPFPKRTDMSFIQFCVKGFYFLLFLAISFFGVLSVFFVIKENNRKIILVYGIPIMFIFILAGYLGYIESRYFVPVYPFFFLFYCFTLIKIFVKIKLLRNMLMIS
ncbi:MAG: glycosyltransferase family 39 protein [Bacteroidota bacterium]